MNKLFFSIITLSLISLSDADINLCLIYLNEDKTMCMQCYDGYVVSFDFMSCFQCTPASYCRTCKQDNLSVCIDCLIGIPNSKNICPTFDNCKVANESDSSKCDICYSGYVVADNKKSCIECTPASKCKTCSSDKLSVCLSCFTGQPDDKNDNKCANLPTIEYCKIHSEDRTKCLFCIDGYVKNSDLQSCIQCAPASNCKTCLVQNMCQTCHIGQPDTQNGFKCAYPRIENCKTKNLNNPEKCDSCYDGYSVAEDFKSCIQCSTVSNCKTCTAANPDYCASCATGSVTNGKCEQSFSVNLIVYFLSIFAILYLN